MTEASEASEASEALLGALVAREPATISGVDHVVIAASYKGHVDYDQQLARQGFQSLNVDTEVWRAGEPEPELSRSTMLVGGVDEVHRALHRQGRSRPSWSDYPEELAPFYGRQIARTTWGALNQLGGEWFVKRPGKGSFQPAVMSFPWKPTGSDDDYNACHVEDDTVLLASEPVEFVAEWRAFCIEGAIADVRQYRGLWNLHVDAAEVLGACRVFRPRMGGYCIDFGLATDGRTLVVETNAGHSLGAYGLRPDLYARLLAAAWEETWGGP